MTRKQHANSARLSIWLARACGVASAWAVLMGMVSAIYQHPIATLGCFLAAAILWMAAEWKLADYHYHSARS